GPVGERVQALDGPMAGTDATRLRDRAGGATSIQRSSPPGPLEGGVHADVPGPGRSDLVLVVDQDHRLADAGAHGRLTSLWSSPWLPPPRAPASGGGPVACSVTSSPLVPRVRRSLPRRRRSAPSARRRPATWRRRRGAPRR